MSIATHSAGGVSYTYDAFNRLTVAGPMSLGYDPAGRLYETSASGTTTRFLYDGLQAIAEYNTAGALIRRYVPGAGLDEHLAWYEGSGTADRRWMVQDERGSVVAVSDGTGAVLSINSYDEYGQPASGNIGAFGYTGQMYLSAAGLYHYRMRAYSPALGRFLQTDPIGGLNLYAYVDNDPINLVDPLGLSPWLLLVPPLVEGAYAGYDNVLDQLRDPVPGVDGGIVLAAVGLGAVQGLVDDITIIACARGGAAGCAFFVPYNIYTRTIFHEVIAEMMAAREESYQRGGGSEASGVPGSIWTAIDFTWSGWVERPSVAGFMEDTWFAPAGSDIFTWQRDILCISNCESAGDRVGQYTSGASSPSRIRDPGSICRRIPGGCRRRT